MTGGCCSPGPANDWAAQFDARRAVLDLRTSRRHGGPPPTARRIELIAAEGVAGATVLDCCDPFREVALLRRG